MKNNNLKAITLSVDGVLFNINQVVKEKLTQLSSEQNLEVPESLFDIYLEGGQQQVHRSKIHFHLFDSYMDEFHNEIQQHLLLLANRNELPVNEGIESLLDFIRQNKLKLALISSYSKELTEKFISAFPYPLTYDILVCGNEVIEGKPEANIYQKCLRQLKLKDSEVLAVETTINGVSSSYLTNIPTVFVELNQLRKEKSQKLSAVQVKTLNHLLDIL